MAIGHHKDQEEELKHGTRVLQQEDGNENAEEEQE
jgi:hypothetical protein